MVPDVLTGWCSDDLHESCPGHLVGAPCVCPCHIATSPKGKTIVTTEQMDEVDAAPEPLEPDEEPRGAADVIAAARVEKNAARPETSDHKPKAKKRPKAKVKTVTEKDADGNEVPIGRAVTLHGVTVTVLDSALGDFEVADSLSLIGEAAEDYARSGNKADRELMEAASNAVSPLLRRLVGYAGSREVLRALRSENGGKVEFEHVVEFIGDLIGALSPNS